MLRTRVVPRLFGKNVRGLTTSIKMLTSAETITEQNSYLPVAEFYAGKSVFVTGGTGFLGRAIIEKLLYSCTDLDKLYVLIRDKKEVKASTRIQDMIDTPVFTRLKERYPNNLNKIVPVVGDTSMDNLGISAAAEKTLIEKVSVVIHSAAIIKFNQRLDVILNTNFEGARRLLNLCQRMAHLQALVHISTAYVHTDNKVLEERIYPLHTNIEEVYDNIERNRNDEQTLRKILGKQPNYYTLSKALTENYVAENHGHVPTIIVRPSCVSGSKSEPEPGWADQYCAIAAVSAHVGTGRNRIIQGQGTNVFDIIPVDYVSNFIIASASRCKRSEDVPVYNLCTSSCNPVTLDEIFIISSRETVKCGLNEKSFPGAIFIKSKFGVDILTFILLTIPAKISDFLLRIRGKKPRHVKNLTQVLALRDAIQYFLSNVWRMKADKTRKLATTLSVEDQRQFPCDPKDISWPEYLKEFSLGANKYVLGKSIKK